MEYDFAVTKLAALRLHTAGWPIGVVTVLQSETFIVRVFLPTPVEVAQLLDWARETAGEDVHIVVDVQRWYQANGESMDMDLSSSASDRADTDE